jgi:hypothetical protein
MVWHSSFATAGHIGFHEQGAIQAQAACGLDIKKVSLFQQFINQAK